MSMQFPNASKFAFSVKSTTARPPKTLEPEIAIVAGAKGKFKLNEAASKLLGLKPADYLVFINNEDQLDAIKAAYAEGDAEAVAWVEEQGGIENLKVQWAIAQGWPMLDINGNAVTTKKPLTNAEAAKLIEEGQVDENGKPIAPEIPAFKGSRLNSKMTDVKVGVILEGTDSNNTPVLRQGHPDDKHVVFSISKEPIATEFPNGNTSVDVNLFLIEFVRLDEKVEKNKE